MYTVLGFRQGNKSSIDEKNSNNATTFTIIGQHFNTKFGFCDQ